MNRIPRGVSLKVALIVPYVALVLGLAIAIGILSYAAGSRAVLVVSEHLLLETVGRIGQAVDRHIVGSGAVLETAFPAGMPAPPDIASDLDELRTRFWIATSLHTDPNDYVYYGNRSGQNLGVLRRSGEEGELRMKLVADEHRARYRFTGIDGPLRFESREKQMFDPRQRPWYKAGETNGSDIWTAVYIDFGTRELVATRARRVLSASGALEGVVATDVSLRALNDFVRNLKVSPNGLAFIIDGKGELIASSVSPNVRTLADGSNVRVAALESGDERLSATYGQVLATLARQPTFPQTITCETESGEYLHAAFDRVKDNAGLDWITVVAMPRKDFLGDVTRNVVETLVMGALAAVLAVVLGMRIIHWVTRDLNDLSHVARGVGEGEFSLPRAIDRHDEIGELARSFETMQQRLQTDRLTGVANRESFIRAVAKRIELSRRDARSKPFGVLFIDLNDFKLVNDQYGHDMGDRVLVEVAARLAQQVRSGDVVARYAGDEFVIMVQDIGSRALLESIRTTVEESLAQPMQSGAEAAGDVPISAAVGMAIFPGEGDVAEDLIKAADLDMYRRKMPPTPSAEV
ncbi:MAG: diguanylate cyclase [Gammaproteobacteria bacterium]|nr:diguanylate cyclase [Gammaproteobacteria bacterium]MBU1416612.1 diguanylate cyclase [Gammaproteobacteria bacterium]